MANFSPRTNRAVLAFQTVRLGFNSKEGAVGPQTAAALELDLGKV